MFSPLLSSLIEQHGYPVIGEADLAAFANARDHCVLFFAGDADRLMESNDLAVILPELIKASAGVLAPIIVSRDAERMLLAAVTQANQAIGQLTRRHPDKRGMGTTMTAAVVLGTEVIIVQVGDSRAYLRRGRMLQQLTMDQNVVGQMVAAGKLRPEDARNFKQRNVLLEAIGVQERVGPDIVTLQVKAGDVLMLCSDGLTGPLADRQVLDHMLRHEDPVRCCRSLTEAACAAGGPDNVTVAMARFVGSDLPLAQPREPIHFERRAAVA